MTDRHKYPPLRIRPQERVRERLARYVERTGRKVNAVVNEALAEWLDKYETDSGKEATDEA